MSRKRATISSGRSVLLVDDNEEYLSATALLLRREGHETLTARSGEEGLAILRTRAVELILVDYFMPGMTGEQFVLELRKFNNLVQVVLQTGYASERPPRELLRRLDIQGYHDKSDGPEKLALWVDIGLKAAYTTQLLAKSRQGLAYILGVTPELHRIQSLEQLLQGVLVQTTGLLGAVDAFVAVTLDPTRDTHRGGLVEGFLATVQGGGEVRVRAGTGRFAGVQQLEERALPMSITALAAVMDGAAITSGEGGTLVPLRVGDATLGLIYLDRPVAHPSDRELLAVFANQASVAMQNMAFFEIAAVDQLTRVYSRRFFEDALQRALRSAHRGGRGIALAFVDVDDLKRINDTAGHLAGDRALAAVGELLRRSIRGSDVVGRFGGDEFVVLLPDTDAAGADVFARRLVANAASLQVEGPDGPIPVRVTVGGAALPVATARVARTLEASCYFEAISRQLLACADSRLYSGKRSGKARAMPIESVPWPGEVVLDAPPREAQSA